jgi:FtsZ-binding cell division protein ZapB
MESDLADIKAKVAELKSSRDDFNDEYKEAQRKNRELKEEKTVKQKEAAVFVRLRASLAGLEEDLARKMSGGEEFRENMQNWEEKMETLVMERASQALRLAVGSISSFIDGMCG